MNAAGFDHDSGYGLIQADAAIAALLAAGGNNLSTAGFAFISDGIDNDGDGLIDSADPDCL